eukprot:scaffold61056_cov17-Tisochrysis_lutea.AAC.1
MHSFHGKMGEYPRAPFPHAHTCILAMASAVAVAAVILNRSSTRDHRRPWRMHCVGSWQLSKESMDRAG